VRCRTGLAITAAVVVALGGCTSAAPHRKQTSAPPAVTTIALPPDTAASSSTAAATPTKAVARTVTVLGSGDVLIHPPLWQQAHADAVAEGKAGYDFGPMYAGIATATRGIDLATCEMETPLAPPQGPFAGWPDFNAPPQVLTALKGVGYKSCTSASNHSLDQGYTGVKRTLDELDAAGLKHTGSARTAAEAATPLIITTPNGVKVGQLAYSFGFNGIPMPAGQPWLANLIDVPTILAAAHRAKQAGADIVVLSMHWGTEYDHLATPEQREEASALLASPDIDVILGDHAHVVQPAERIHGKWVVYCMGNQISRHADPVDESREGVMPKFTFTEVSPHKFAATSAQAIPTWMDISPKLRLIDLPAALADPATPADRRATYERAHREITTYLDAYGATKAGFIVE
jgi:poly-gamma-glutamate capsule biosynthesis protein CapA/YwtB (metallophosphatase superfamily)